MLLHVPEVLGADQVRAFRSRLKDAEWADGGATAGFQSKTVKHNLQLPESSEVARELGIPPAQLPPDLLLATGATPRILPDAQPDGERILTWVQMYNLTELPEHLVVVGSGVTGAEFASAYNGLDVPVSLVSSRDHVLPGEDEDAAELIETVFRRRGMTVLSRSRAAAVRRTDDGVAVELTDGRVVQASHCLVAVGGVPNTEGLGLDEAGVELTESGHVLVDRVSRTTAPRVYAAGDCTGVFPLASVAAMQGRVAMWHSLGDAVAPLDVDAVTATVFTAPEMATIGVTVDIEDVESATYAERFPAGEFDVPVDGAVTADGFTWFDDGVEPGTV